MEATTVTEASVHGTAAIDMLLVGPYPIFRQGLRMLLEGEPGFNVVGDASNADEALKAITNFNPHIVIVTLSGRPLVRLMQALRNLSADGSRTRTILLTTAIEEMNIVQAQELGVAEILSKETSPQMLIDCVRRIAADHCWFGRRTLDHLADGMRHLRQTHKNRFGLTTRELETIEAIVRSLQPSSN